MSVTVKEKKARLRWLRGQHFPSLGPLRDAEGPLSTWWEKPSEHTVQIQVNI